MARTAILDKLQNHKFWLTDISSLSPASIPVLNPLAGFTSISAPSMTLQTMKIVQGNNDKDVTLTKGVTYGNITLSAGVGFNKTDFFNWMVATTSGDMDRVNRASFLKNQITNLLNNRDKKFPSSFSPRRNLLLIQFFSRSILGTGSLLQSGFESIPRDGGPIENFQDGRGTRNDTFLGRASNVAMGTIFDTINGLQLNLPVRAWLLIGCIPIDYKASQDFSASDASVSIHQLILAPEKFEEISL